MKDFRELKVWEKAHRLTLKIYHATKEFPQEERFGMTSQMRRTAASVPTNIAEGCGRDGDREFTRFLEIAFASASELEYLLLLSRDLEMLPSTQYEPLTSETVEVKKMLFSLIRKLKPEA